MSNPRRAITCCLFCVATLAQIATANLVTDGYFQNLTYSGTKSLTTLYGQFGTGTGSTLTLANWNTTGYNFVYAPNTADAGTKNGANSSQPNEAPGQYNASSGYGSTYLWGSNNGGTGTITLRQTPASGNFIAADGAFQTGPITQAITGLTVGAVYALNFYWAAAQQQNYTSATASAWQVTLGSQSFTTPIVRLPSKGFSGWMQQTFNFTANNSSETLSFLAAGTPTGQPPLPCSEA